MKVRTEIRYMIKTQHGQLKNQVVSKKQQPQVAAGFSESKKKGCYECKEYVDIVRDCP